jgi:hypothetical protein
MSEIKLKVDASGTEISLPILMDGGPLCVAGVYDRELRIIRHKLYRIYLKRLGATFGPYYALLGAAYDAMRKTIKHFPSGFWEAQSFDWYGRQNGFHDWIDTNLGKPGDLVGAEWARD